MSFYRYRACNSAGENLTGAAEAENVSALENRLRGAGIWLLEAHESQAARADANHISNIRVRRADLITFFIQMALLLRAGITLAQALERLAADFSGSKLGPVLDHLYESISVGNPLHRSMERYPNIFSRQIISMVQAGEASGQLPEVFQNLSAYYEWLDQLISDIRQALIYPVMVLSAAVALITLLFTFVVPKFVTLLTDLKLEVPTLTRIVMAISETLIHGWPIILATLIILPVALKLALRSPDLARSFDENLMKIPIFGSLIGMFALSRFTQNLAMLYKAGIPLLRGLEITRNLVGNRAIAAAIDDAHDGVAQGVPLSKGLARHTLFPPTLITMIATGESSGSLDVALQSVADYYNKMIPRRIKIVFAVFDPLMMLSLIGIVGLVALSVILPILQLWSAR